jgi:hypothetical protein
MDSMGMVVVVMEMLVFASEFFSLYGERWTDCVWRLYAEPWFLLFMPFITSLLGGFLFSFPPGLHSMVLLCYYFFPFLIVFFVVL